MKVEGRRRFLMVAAGASVLLAGRAARAKAPAAEVAPPEDLMREHGVLNRILLIYEESIRRLEGAGPFAVETLAGAAEIVRRFIEQYHEKLEEDYLFPRFEKANKLVDLVGDLRRQHQAGRVLTATILKLGTADGTKTPGGRKELVAAMRAFIRMYRPHEAREDTVLFPAFRDIVKPKEFIALGETFEDKEHALFGKEGFEGVVAQVAKLEQTLGIYDLAQFTPR